MKVDDPRLDCAILRPMESDGDHFLAYYLTKDDETAFQFKDERLARSPDAPEEDEVRPKLAPSCRILMRELMCLALSRQFHSTLSVIMKS